MFDCLRRFVSFVHSLANGIDLKSENFFRQFLGKILLKV